MYVFLELDVFYRVGFHFNVIRELENDIEQIGREVLIIHLDANCFVDCGLFFSATDAE